jgi:methenyltetrahydromethanopterin cyclohydrolase
MHLNQNALRLCEQAVRRAERLRIAVEIRACGCRILDFGVAASGGLEAGIRLAEICMAGLATVTCLPTMPELWQGPAICVWTDHPVAACMASQYAGWEVGGDDFFAMASGPMRAAAASEKLFETIGHRESTERAVGVLETRTIPPEEICRRIAADCGVAPKGLTLLIAPTASQAGNVQIVARSVETALHKLHALGMDLARIESGWGTAPLPPVAGDDLTGIGRTNDAILYGGQVTLWVRDDDDALRQIGPKIPSSASPDHGEPFIEIFRRAGGDFSPATVTLVNLETGNSFRFGHTRGRVLHESFGTVG